MLLFQLFLVFSIQKTTKENVVIPSVPPISVSVDMMTKTGSYGTSTKTECPKDKVATEPCGKTAWFNPASQGKNPPTFSYTFKGELVQVYGKYDRDHGKMRVYIDNKVVTEINQYVDGDDQFYVLQYTSELLPYEWHTIKVEPIGDDIEIYKFAYWPSIHAQRKNSTEINDKWNIESDGIGGLREWAHENNKAGVKKLDTFQFSKIWVYGSSAIGHGKMFCSINGEEHLIEENTTNRIDNYLLYESEMLPLNDYTITFSQYFEDCILYCIYYIAEPQPTAPPISVPIELMTITGSYGTSPNGCPNDKVATKPCGTTAWFNPASHGNNPPTFSYTFKGEKFEVYGKYDNDHGKMRIYLDNQVVAEVDQNTQGPDVSYVSQYTSDILPYGEHTIKVEPMNDDIELYKFAYWPSIHALRVNSTEIKPLWNVESDKIGGLREWANENSHTAEKKTRTLHYSKLWVYGSTNNNHGDMMFSINGETRYINQNTTTRHDAVLLYESDYVPLADYTLSFSQHIEDCLLYCIYYLPISPPTPVPISVPVSQINITGAKKTSTNNLCPNEIIDRPCGETAWYNPVNADQSKNKPTFNYKFKGVKFQIFGKYDDSHGYYSLYLDGQFVKNISQKGRKDATHQLQYTSELLPYGDHSISLIPYGEFELYKFTYWPYLGAERKNSTEMKPLWNVESDKIGGLREWANEVYHTAEKKEITLPFSKIWVYGSLYTMHEKMKFVIDGEEILINQHTDGERVDGVLVYESEFLPLKNYTISFSQYVEDCLLNQIFYYPFPSPEPDPEDFIIDESVCKKDTHCEKIVNDVTQNVHVYIDISSFNGVQNKEGNGGAICIENAALKVNKSEFVQCDSTNGAGGAIYVRNTFDITCTYLLENLKFDKCEAEYGGAVYIYAESRKVTAIIKYCKFTGNLARAPKSTPNNNFGGSAVYLWVYKGEFNGNTFESNKGPGGALKIVNDFPSPSSSSSSLRTLGSSSAMVKIAKCDFVIHKDADCSIYYLQGRNGPSFEISNCRFDGKLAHSAHHIDGAALKEKSSPKLLVQSCKFSSDAKKAFSKAAKMSFLSVDISSQIFEGGNAEEKKERRTWKVISTIVLPVIGVLAVIAIAVAIIVPKRMRQKAPLDAEIPAEMQDSLL